MRAAFYKLSILLTTCLIAFAIACTEKVEPRVTIDISYKDLGDGKIQFNNSTLNANTFFWDFADGTTSTEKAPIHTYKESGIYNVFFRAKNDSEEKTSTLVFNITKDTLVITKNVQLTISRMALIPGTGPLKSRRYTQINNISYNFKEDTNIETPYYQFSSINLSEGVEKKFSELSLQFKNFDNINTKITNVKTFVLAKVAAISKPFIIIIQREDKLPLNLNTDSGNGLQFKPIKVLKIQVSDIMIFDSGSSLILDEFDLEKSIKQTPSNQKEIQEFNSNSLLVNISKEPFKFHPWYTLQER